MRKQSFQSAQAPVVQVFRHSANGLIGHSVYLENPTVDVDVLAIRCSLALNLRELAKAFRVSWEATRGHTCQKNGAVGGIALFGYGHFAAKHIRDDLRPDWALRSGANEEELFRVETERVDLFESVTKSQSHTLQHGPCEVPDATLYTNPRQLRQQIYASLDQLFALPLASPGSTQDVFLTLFAPPDFAKGEDTPVTFSNERTITLR
jgi:hypothetical protein